MLKVYTVSVTPFDQNARILVCSETNEGVVVDPGGDAPKISAEIRKQKVSVKEIWLTHSHLDHCGGVQPLLEELGVPLVAHPGETLMRQKVRSIAAMYGMPPDGWYDCPEPTVPIVGGETRKVGNLSAEVLFTPGHSPGHVSFLFRDDNCIASGDVLFAGSIGRTDLPGGNHQQLIMSIKEHLLALPDETTVLCGHGDDTTIGRERRTNPFLQ